MTPRLLLRTTLLSAALLAPAAPAFAYLDTFIHGDGHRHHEPEGIDRVRPQRARRAEQRRRRDDGLLDRPRKSKRKPIEGRADAAAQQSPTRASPARQLKAQLKRGDQEDNWTGWFCKQGDGPLAGSRTVAND
ncbi:hypothetical protein ACU4GD_07810 [Cupriavidus basilensis]